MTLPVLGRRPTHRAFPLLRSEVSRLTHRRFARFMALILLGGVVIISVIVFMVSGTGGASREQLLENQAESQQMWLDCSQNLADPDRVRRFCGDEPNTQPLESFDWQGDRRYKAYEGLPVALIGASIAAAGVAFLIGASFGGAEWSSRSMTLQLLFEPRRLRLLTVKWLALLLCTAVLALLTMALALAFGAITASMRGTWSDEFALDREFRDAFESTMVMMGLRGLILVAFAATIGYAIAMLVRNTSASLGVAFVYFVVLENGIRFALMKYGTEPFMRITNAVSFLFPGGLEVPGRDPGGFAEVPMVTITNMRAFWTLLTYVAVLSVPTAWFFTRRDIS